jgi:CelD/BcsL family acetyltransferase involved in cellulose biosynthesis
VLRRIDAGGAVAGAFMHAMAQRGLGLQAGQRSRRAVLRPASAGAQALKAGSKRRAAELRRCRRRLTEVGVLDWLLIDEGALTEAADNFLRLEHLGWKGDARTSLRSKAGDTAFFQACIRGLAAQNQVWFTELRLNGQAIASTCNFRSGGAGFAFKVGWDPTWRRYGPGWLNEAALVEAAPQACADMAYIDSGATAGSFIDELWPERRELVDLQLPLSMYGDLALRSLGLLRRLKRRLVPDLTPAPEARRKTSGSLEDVR